MNTAIQVLWWIGLIVALGFTAVILKQVSLLVGTLRDIDVLAEHTRIAAEGAAENVRSDDALAGLPEPLANLASTMESLAGAAADFASRINTFEGRR